MWMLIVALAHAGSASTTLLPRDGVACSALGSVTPELRAELATLAVTDMQPSYVPMRAAGCLLELFATDPALGALVTPWVQDPELRGLGLLVLERGDLLPVETELAVARAAVAVDDARWGPKYRDRVGRSARAEVRAVLDGGAGVR